MLTTPAPCPTPTGCATPQPCSEVFDSQCIVYSGDTITCTNDIVVLQNSTLAGALNSIVEYFCSNTAILSIDVLCNTDIVIAAGSSYQEAFTSLSDYYCARLKSVDDKVNDVNSQIACLTYASGTADKLVRWTPDGCTLNTSLIYDNGTSVYSRGAGDLTSNTAFGENALIANTTGSLNTVFGKDSLKNNTTGQNNTALGVSTLIFNTTGFSNTAIGGTTLANNTNGYNNTAIGYASLSSNTTGTNNSAVGYASLLANTTGAGNTAFGYNTLLQNSASNYNTVIGFASLSSHTTGNGNTTLGAFALEKLLTGQNNIALGPYAGRTIASGSDLTTSNGSIFIGQVTKASVDGSLNEIVIGSGSTGLGQNTTVIGNISTVLTRLEGQLQLDDVPAGTPVNNLGIDAGGNVIVGTSGAVSGSGITDYITKWSSTTGLTISQLIESSGRIGYGGSPISAFKMFVSSSTAGETYAFVGATTVNGAVGVSGRSNGVGASANYGLSGTAQGSSSLNVGVYALVQGTSTENIGIYSQAATASNNYSIQLLDGTEGIGKALGSVTGDGKANWVKIDSTYTTGASGSFTTTDGQTVTVTNGLITNIV
jgi:hypothetical protein